MSFFFFKQKTAYELRISDWSSDVCSSDLSARSKSICNGGIERSWTSSSSSMWKSTRRNVNGPKELMMGTGSITDDAIAWHVRLQGPAADGALDRKSVV